MLVEHDLHLFSFVVSFFFNFLNPLVASVTYTHIYIHTRTYIRSMLTVAAFFPLLSGLLDEPRVTGKCCPPPPPYTRLHFYMSQRVRSFSILLLVDFAWNFGQQ